jgi:autotransporter-associated beta strand protein
MNRIYRLVWNRTLGVLQVASELASSPGGETSADASERRSSVERKPLARTLTFLLSGLPVLFATLASPQAFASTISPVYTVTQSTDDGSGTVVGTLSWAISQSNTNSGSTIAIALSSGSSITVSGTLPTLTASTTIDDGADVVLNQPLVANAMLTFTGSGQLDFAGTGTHLNAGATLNGASAALTGSGSSLTGTNGTAGGYSPYTNGGNGTVGSVGVTGGASGFTLGNAGTISGGNGGVGGNSGFATGGTGGVGGVAVSGSNFTLTNNVGGTIDGGGGGGGGVGYNISGGAGAGGGIAISGSNFTATNTGTIAGGNGGNGGNGDAETGGTGGVGGVAVSGSNFTLTNNADGTISGGNGGNGGASSHGSGGSGADGGIAIGASNFTATNAGTIRGGDGGNGGGGLFYNGSGGNGGAAISGANITLTNTGTIAGGNGGTTSYNFFGNGSNGAGGVGIIATGDTHITSSGVITGGDGSTGVADAIDFSNGGNTLILEVGSTTTGNITSTSGSTNGGDTLILGDNAGGGGSDSLNIGGVSGFATYEKTGTSTWTLTGAGANQDWQVQGGTLQGDATAFAGNITFDPATGDTALVVFDQGSGNTNSPTTATYAGVISGDGGLGKIDDGTLILTGNNTYTGGTTISGGTLQLGNGGTSGLINGDVIDNGTLAFDRGDAVSFAGTISGSGGIAQLGSGSTTLTATNTYTGATTISSGTLALNGNGSIAASTGVTDNATFDISGTTSGASIASLSGNGTVNLGTKTLTLSNADDTFAGTMNGSGGLTLTNGDETLTGDNTYSGGTTISGGTLQIDTGGTTGAITGDVTDNGTLVFDRSDTVTFTGTISGTGALNQIGSGTLTLDGTSTYTGMTSVTTGTLLVGDSASGGASIGGDASVATGATLGGHGTIGGNVTIVSGAYLAPGGGGGIGTLTIHGNLTVAQGGILDYEFGAPGSGYGTAGTGDQVSVGNNLTLNGATLNINADSSFGQGLYTLFNYGGTLTETNGGITIGSAPTGDTLSIQTLTASKQINLINTGGTVLHFWNANGLASPTQMGGGSGTWSVISSNWTDANGDITAAMSPQSGFAIFGGAAGTVTVDDSQGNVTVTGMQFATDGYVLNGDTLTLVADANGSTPTIRVGDGSTTGASDTATIDNVLAGTAGLNKTDYGTLVLTGNNTYTGGTTISGGTLQLGNGGTSGSISGSVIDNGTLAFDHSNDIAFSGTISGTGGVTQLGGDILTLNATNTYTGNTAIASGSTLALSGQGSIANSAQVIDNGIFDISGAAAGASISTLSGTGSVALGGNTLTLTDASGEFDGSIHGTGGLSIVSSESFTLSGSNTYTGGTSLMQGTLALASNLALGTGALSMSDGTTLALVTNGLEVGNTIAISGNGAVDVASGLSATLSGMISDGTQPGSLIKTGAGTLILAGANTYSGTTTISAGTLQVGHGGSTGSISNTVVDNGSLVFDRSDDLTYGGTISGTGSLIQIGGNTVILDSANTYSGTTTVQSGTLEVGDADHTSASIDSDVVVEADGILRGHGSIDGTVTNDGIVWPGGSIGTLTLNGNYTQNSDGVLQIDITPSGASELVVNGTATLAGTLSLLYAPGTYSSTKYTLLSATSVSGTFANVTTTGSQPVDTTLSYMGTQVDLGVASATATTTVAPLDANLYGDLMRAQDLVSQQTLQSVLGVGLRGTDGCDAGVARTNQASASCSSGVWAQYTGGSDSLTGNDGLHSTTFGLQGGYDVAAGDLAHVGVEAGYNRVNGNDREGGNGKVDSEHGGLYAYANSGPVMLSAVIDQTHSSYRVDRQTGIGYAVGNPDGNTTSVALQAALPFNAAQWTITPAVGTLYQHQALDGFNETIASTNLLASAFPVRGALSTYNTLQPYAQVQFGRTFQAQGVTYLPQLEVGYRYDTRNDNAPIVTMTTQDGTVFAMPGENTGRGTATVGAHISAQVGASWNLYLDYHGQFASHERDNALSAGFTKHF